MRRGLISATFAVLGATVVGCTRASACRPVAPPARPPIALRAELPRQTIELGNGVRFEMVLIPAGEFDMGSPETEEGRDDDEVRHRVRITQSYWLATTELTQAAWEAVMGANPSTVQGPTRPVTDVSWADGQAFLKRLNEKVAGGGFRLPTEAEWEYACRAGNTTKYGFGDDEEVLAEYAWYGESAVGSVHPVRALRPNAWGLHDMHGNAGEWCADSCSDYVVSADGPVLDPAGSTGHGSRVVRGGAWYGPAGYARCANRGSFAPDAGNRFTGLRLARTVAADATPTPARGMAPPALPRAPAPKPGDPAPLVAPPAEVGDVPSWAKVAPEQIEAAKQAGVPVALENSIGMRFVLIPAGTFTMGSPETEWGRWDDETQHEVTLTNPYYLGITEVTNGQYRRFRADHRSGHAFSSKHRSLDDEDQPVANVSWDDVVAFAQWISAKYPGRTYRLPTEAEWERACGAGTTTPFWYGRTLTSDLANYLGDWSLDQVCGPVGVTRHETVPVGSLPPSPWGLHEMHGSVSEWCMDSYGEYGAGRVTDPTGAAPAHPSAHVLRGGSFYDAPYRLRAASRSAVPIERDYRYGVRLAVSVPPNPVATRPSTRSAKGSAPPRER